MPASERPALQRLGIKVLVGLLLAGMALGLLEREARSVPTSFRQKRLGLEAAAPTMEALVLGPSVALNGVDPSVWARPAYNLANNGQSLYYDRALFERAAPGLPRLRWVLVGVARSGLQATVVSMNEAARGFALRQQFGIPHEDPSLRWDVRNASAALTLEPWKVLVWALTGRGLVLGDLQPTGQERLPPLDADQQELQLSGLVAQKHAQRHWAMMTQPRTYGLAQLDTLLAAARARDLGVAVFIPPVSAAYAQDMAEGRAEDLAALRALCARRGAAFHDYFQDPRFGDADFADVDHLAWPAAGRFSRILAQDLLPSDFLPSPR